MKTHFKVGQVVRFKNYKLFETEREAYFIVIQEEDATNYQINLTSLSLNFQNKFKYK